MVVKTTSPCVACAEAGVKNFLSYDTDKYTDGPLPVFCSKGHNFPSLEDAEAYTAALPPPEPIAAPAEPPSQLPLEPAAEASREAARPSLEPLEAIPETAAAVEEPKPAPPAPKKAPARAVAPKAAPAAVAVAEVAPPANGSYVAPKAREIAGGNLMMTVRIPEQHTSFLRGEAERQNESVEAYFQRMVEFGMDSRWFY